MIKEQQRSRLTVRWIRLLVTAFLVTATLLASATSCARILRQPVVGPRPQDETDTILLRRLDPFLLSDLVTRKVIVEVDWVAGCEPAPKALTGAEAFLRRYVPAVVEIVFEKDDEIPRKEWEMALKEDRYERTDRLVDAHLDHTPDPEAGLELLYVLYTPRQSLEERRQGHLGHAAGWLVHRGDRVFHARGVQLHKETIRTVGVLWITDDRVERNVLIHEMGHELGAVANPRHEWRGNLGHCANPNCIMTYATPRAILYNFLPAFFTARLPMNFCRDCRADILRAQELWRARADRYPAFVDGLRARNESRRLGAEASDLFHKGDRPGAVAKYREALELAPDEAWIYERIAQLLRQDKRFDEAIEAYRSAMRVDSDPHVRVDLGHLLCDRGRYAEALELVDPAFLRREMARSDFIYPALLLRQRALMGMGRGKDVFAFWDEYVRTKGLDSQQKTAATWHAAKALRRSGDFERAIEMYERLPRKSRRTAAYGTARARLELARGRKGEADQWLDEAASMLKAQLEKARPDQRLWLWSDRVVVLALARKDDEARALLDAVPPHEDWSKDSIAWTRARTLALVGDVDRAMKALEEASDAEYLSNDPCLDEDLAGLRDEPRFRELFPWCLSDDR